MKWDAGALSPNRNKSPIFRYLSNNPPYQRKWPPHYIEELGIFLRTPGVTWRWCVNNFNLSTMVLQRVFEKTAHLHHLGKENVLSVTYDDALMYSKHRPFNSPVPFWVKPFIFEDIKKGQMTKVAIGEKWGIDDRRIREFKSRRQLNVFYPS